MQCPICSAAMIAIAQGYQCPECSHIPSTNADTCEQAQTMGASRLFDPAFESNRRALVLEVIGQESDQRHQRVLGLCERLAHLQVELDHVRDQRQKAERIASTVMQLFKIDSEDSELDEVLNKIMGNVLQRHRAIVHFITTLNAIADESAWNGIVAKQDIKALAKQGIEIATRMLPEYRPKPTIQVGHHYENIDDGSKWAVARVGQNPHGITTLECFSEFRDNALLTPLELKTSFRQIPIQDR